MMQLSLQEAERHLAELINRVAGGEDVIITRNDGLSFKIVPFQRKKPRPVFGSAKGLIKMAEDFDAPLDDFKEYMP